MLEDFIGTIRRPDVLYSDGHSALRSQIASEGVAKFHKLAVGVAVDHLERLSDGAEDALPNLLGNRVGVLVDVQSDPHVNHRRTIRRLSPKVVANGQVREGRHSLIVAGA